MTDFNDMLQKAKLMQQQMKEAQDEIKNIQVEGVSGGNLVKVILSGDYELKSIFISEAAKKESQEIINDLIIAAFNNAKENLKKKSSEEIVCRLTQIKGIGKWTAQIYCLFSLGKANIFPSGDLALQEAIKIIFGLKERPSEQEVIKISENWHPWKSLAAHLLWDYYNKIKKKV